MKLTWSYFQKQKDAWTIQRSHQQVYTSAKESGSETQRCWAAADVSADRCKPHHLEAESDSLCYDISVSMCDFLKEMNIKITLNNTIQKEKKVIYGTLAGTIKENMEACYKGTNQSLSEMEHSLY